MPTTCSICLLFFQLWTSGRTGNTTLRSGNISIIENPILMTGILAYRNGFSLSATVPQPAEAPEECL